MARHRCQVPAAAHGTGVAVPEEGDGFTAGKAPGASRRPFDMKFCALKNRLPCDGRPRKEEGLTVHAREFSHGDPYRENAGDGVVPERL